MLTDVQTPLLGTPVVPLKITKKARLRETAEADNRRTLQGNPRQNYRTALMEMLGRTPRILTQHGTLRQVIADGIGAPDPNPKQLVNWCF